MTKRKRREPEQETSQPSKLADRPVVDIVVPVYGRVDLLQLCLEALPAAIMDIPYRLIIVDDGTPDDSVTTFLEKYDLRARKLVTKENKGYPAAVNIGARHGTAPLILVLTTDVIMQPGSLAELVKEMDDPEVGVVGCKLLFPKESKMGPPERIQHAGIAFSLNARPFHIFMGWTPDHPKVNVRREMRAVTGACFITRRSVFVQIGGLNEVYGKGTYEDMEYCFMVKESAKKKVIFTPKAWGYHHVGASAGQGYPLGRNSAIFQANMGGMFEWDEWRYW